MFASNRANSGDRCSSFTGSIVALHLMYAGHLMMTCRFHCRHCQVPILLPYDTLGRPFGDPKLRGADYPSVFFACSRCKRVGSYSLNQNSPDYDPLGLLEVRQPLAEETMFLTWLECEGINCRIQKPLFAQWSPDTTELERRVDVKTWQWDGLRCPQGHEILKQGS